MNIALIIHELLIEGGGERQCVSLARALSRQGHQVILYTSAYDRNNCFPDICKDIVIKEVGRGLFSWLRKPLFVRGYLDMKKLAAAVGAKHDVWNPHHWPAQWGAVWLKQKLGGTVVWMCNDVPIFHQISQKQGPSSGLLRKLVHYLYYLYDCQENRKVDLTLFLSRWAESEFKLIYQGNTCVVRSGADPDRFQPGGNHEKIRKRFGYQTDDFVLLWLGIFMPHRRLEDAIEALAHLKHKGTRVRLLLAGSGDAHPDYFRFLKDQVQKLGLQEDVTFAGKVEDGEIRDYYCACDAFVFPNELQTWGLAVLEAMSCGCPVLVSEGAAVHEILTDGETAVLFPARQPEALAAKIELLVTHPDLKRGIAEAGTRLVRTNYNWERFAEQMEQVFRSNESAAPMQETYVPATDR